MYVYTGPFSSWENREYKFEKELTEGDSISVSFSYSNRVFLVVEPTSAVNNFEVTYIAEEAEE